MAVEMIDGSVCPKSGCSPAKASAMVYFLHGPVLSNSFDALSFVDCYNPVIRLSETLFRRYHCRCTARFL